MYLEESYVIKITETGGNHLRTLVRTSSLCHTGMFSVLVFVTLLWLVCAVFSSSHCDGQCAQERQRQCLDNVRS